MIQRGDLLLYDKYDSGVAIHFLEKLIVLGEELEKSNQSDYFFHVAIALSDTEKVEADGEKVAVHPIAGDGFKIFRPPVDKDTIETALNAVQATQGFMYDWVEIVNDALLDATKQKIHLPDKLMQILFKHTFICSRLGAFYVKQLGFPMDLSKENIDPEDLKNMISSWEVKI